MAILLGVVTLDWITADELYGRNGEFLDEVEQLGLRYVVEVPVTTTVWTEDPASCVPPYGGHGRVPSVPTRESVASVVMVASDLSSEAWQTLKIRDGAKGPLAFEFAAVRVWAVRHGKAGPPVWLLVRRSLDPTPEVKYYISNGDASTPLRVLAEVACTRHAVEDYFEDAKSYLGMAQYETRSWVGWHHHMSLVAMAHLFITQTQRALKKKAPELTLDRTVRLLQRAFEVPGLTLELAVLLVEYHIRRNKVARQSHTKTWWARHEGVKLQRQ
jgi:SRSO17 transposase